MRVQDDPIRVGEIASPSIDASKSVSDGDVEAFANTSDFSESIVGLDVAAQRAPSHVSRGDWMGTGSDERTMKSRHPFRSHSEVARS